MPHRRLLCEFYTLLEGFNEEYTLFLFTDVLLLFTGESKSNITLNLQQCQLIEIDANKHQIQCGTDKYILINPGTSEEYGKNIHEIQYAIKNVK